MESHDAFQAKVLIATISELHDTMVARLSWLERRDGPRRDITALRRDIDEARSHIARLHARYLAQARHEG